MGEVFLAWDELLERRVAIKRIRQGSPQTHDQRERFRREARSAARLSHSAIVQIHELIPDLAGDAIVMEYVEGTTLGDRIARGPLPVREALRLAREIAEGLAAAHAAGLIHRDLKPENVIITPQGQAKILDFGLVKPVHAEAEDQTLTRKGILLGTYCSMSPEQASGGDVDQRSDLFSLGILLYEMLSGHAPFRGDNPLATLKRVIADRPPALSTVRDSIPQGVSDLVDRLLAKNRDDRPHSAGTVIRMLQTLEASQPISSSDSVSEMVTADLTKLARKSERQTRPLTSTGGMSINRRRRHVVAAGAVALVAVGLIAMPIMTRRAPQKPAGQLANLREEDADAFLLVQRRIDSGEAGVLGPEFEEIDRIVRENPRNLGSHLLGIRIALKLYQSSRAPLYLDRAVDLVQRAKALSPHNLDLLGLELQVDLENNMPHATAVLDELKKLLPPDDPRVLLATASLVERQGRWQEAMQYLTTAIEKDPAWQNRVKLAQLEAHHGLANQARDLLKAVSSESPGNIWAQETLAEIELSYGNAAEAERLFLELTKSSQRRNPLTNLGQAQFFLGHYEDAMKTYRSALDLAPYNPTILLDLADAEVELGHFDDAWSHYQRALERVQETERFRKARAPDLLIKAQCLARLGKNSDAEKMAEEALRRSPGSPAAQYQAALVFSLSGNHRSALKNLKSALDGGIPKSWFRCPVFQVLASEPEYQRLIVST